MRKNEAELTGLLSQMIASPTINPPGDGYAGFVEGVARWGEKRGLGFQILTAGKEEGDPVSNPTKGPRFAVLLPLKGTAGHPKLVFQGHYDTVAPSDAWTRNPFVPVIEERNLYGLGASDMKGGLAAMIMACLALKELGAPLSGDLYFLATPDEELPSSRGMSYFLHRVNLDFQGAIVGEPSGGDRIIIGMKSGTWGCITIRGRSCHGSRPQEGVNAFEKMAAFVAEADKELRPALMECMSPLNYLPSGSNHNTLMFGGTIQGSNAGRSTVPDRCTVSFDLRTVPDQSSLVSENRLRRFIVDFGKRNPDASIEIEIASRMAGFAITGSTEKDDLLAILAACLRENIGREPIQYVTSGAQETHLFHKRGIPALSFGPGSPSACHAADESVNLDKLLLAAETYAATAYLYLS